MLGQLLRASNPARASHTRGGRALSTQVRTVTLIPGDGIGPEIAQAVQR